MNPKEAISPFNKEEFASNIRRRPYHIYIHTIPPRPSAVRSLLCSYDTLVEIGNQR